MKYLESKLVCVNVVRLPVGKQNDIGHEIYAKVWEKYKIKIVTATFMNMSRSKWMILSYMIKYLTWLIVSI